jgi:hypothetical protein
MVFMDSSSNTIIQTPSNHPKRQQQQQQQQRKIPDSPTSVMHLQYDALDESTTAESSSSTAAPTMNTNMTPFSSSNAGDWLESQGQWDLAMQEYRRAVELLKQQ